MNHKQTIEDINKLRGQLHPDNERYLGDMILYLRSSRISQRKGDELLLEMAVHLVEAQEEGRCAQDVFGDDPEAYCNELIKEIPRPAWKEHVHWQGLIFWNLLTWMLAGHALSGIVLLATESGTNAQGFDLSLVLINIPIANILVAALFLTFKKSVFKKDDRKYWIGMWLILCVFTSLAVMAGMLLKDQLPSLYMSPWVSLLAAAIGFIGQKFLFFPKAKSAL
ncbi:MULTISPECIES: DUF1129 family protein [Paenibacillus]|uniref:DUF1129 family protein n=1 Tax=Paenibacillus TaxID=44249 RepID=UPI0022B8EF88|nr:DUF1129 family protein [Paenibacillus caseinilyticus]MCZ8521254.1 DUF1129 family protein [Paenibacillus caseinilyticus]